jgi:phosphotriesterase-related protein
VSHVMTVRGPVDPTEIGPTLTHEHIFWTAEQFYDPSQLHDPALGVQPMEPRFGGLARWYGSSFKDNLRQLPDADYALIAEEVQQFLDAGGSCIVELTLEGLTPFPLDLRRISEELDFHIVEGVGFYVQSTHPEWLADASVDDIEAHLLAEVREGVRRSGVLPGIIGELGTSEQLHPVEERVLRAGVRVAGQTGLPINLHCNPPELPVIVQILDVLEEEGHDMTHLSLSHLDEITDLDYHETVLQRGVLTGFDSFGQDGYFEPTWKSLSDLEKMTTMVALIERGYEDQLLMSQDMGKKHYLQRFGGMGYDHVSRRIIPRLIAHHGVSEAQLQKLMVDNPRRLLTIAGDPPVAGGTA